MTHVSINKQLMSFQNCFGSLSQFCQGMHCKTFSHFKWACNLPASCRLRSPVLGYAIPWVDTLMERRSCMAVLVLRHCILKLKQKKTCYKQIWMHNKGCVIFRYQKITFIPVIIHFLIIVAGPG